MSFLLLSKVVYILGKSAFELNVTHNFFSSKSETLIDIPVRLH